MEPKPIPRRVSFVPRAAGVSVFAAAVLAFAAGAATGEIALIIAGAVFAAVWGYCLVLTLLLALVHARRALRASIRIVPAEADLGASVEAFYAEAGTGAALPPAGIFQLPGILVRCRLTLATVDGRRIEHDFSPARVGPHAFAAEKRGAYFPIRDEFAVMDILGFFRLAIRLPSGEGGTPRLLVRPRPAGEPPATNARAGDSESRPEFSLRRSDVLTDNRPYAPGDDPRRINWKLYGHGGGLFVREGERENPPHANLTILVDTEYDPALYGIEEARVAVDMLCAHALSAATAFAESGMDVAVGELGRSAASAEEAGEREGTLRKFAAALAWPAACPIAETGIPDRGTRGEPAPLPRDRGVLVFALPRTRTDTALDGFLGKIAAGAKDGSVDLLFVCRSAKAAEPISARGRDIFAAADLCVSLFLRKPGVRARLLAVD